MAFETAQISTLRNGSSAVVGSRQDLAENDVVTASIVTPGQAPTTYAWYLVGRPEYSTAGGSGANPWSLGNSATASFTVDPDSGGVHIDGTYILLCVLNQGANSERRISVELARVSGLTIPAQGGGVRQLRKLGMFESLEDTISIVNILAGWSTMMNRWLEKVRLLAGGGGGSQTLAATYSIGVSSGDQTATLLDANGGPIKIDASNAGFTGTAALTIKAATGGQDLTFTKLGKIGRGTVAPAQDIELQDATAAGLRLKQTTTGLAFDVVNDGLSLKFQNVVGPTTIMEVAATGVRADLGLSVGLAPINGKALALAGGSNAAPLSAAASGRFQYNNDTGTLQFSQNGGPWTNFGTGSGSVAVPTDEVVVGTGSNVTGNAALTYNNSTNGDQLALVTGGPSPLMKLQGTATAAVPQDQVLNNLGHGLVLSSRGSTASSPDSAAITANNANGLAIATLVAAALSLLTNNTAAVTIDATQQVGIGTTVPTSIVDVLATTPILKVRTATASSSATAETLGDGTAAAALTAFGSANGTSILTGISAANAAGLSLGGTAGFVKTTGAAPLYLGVNGTQVGAQISAAGSFVAGTGALLAAGATNGFTYLAGVNGQPSGTPTTFTGSFPFTVDVTSATAWFYSAGAWHSLLSSAAINQPQDQVVYGGPSGVGLASSSALLFLHGATNPALTMQISGTSSASVSVQNTNSGGISQFFTLNDLGTAALGMGTYGSAILGTTLGIANANQTFVSGNGTALFLVGGAFGGAARPIIGAIQDATGSTLYEGLRLTLGATDASRVNTTIGGGLIAPNGTDGWLYISSTNGTPTGTITTFTGRSALTVDVSNHGLWYNDGIWRRVANATEVASVNQPQDQMVVGGVGGVGLASTASFTYNVSGTQDTVTLVKNVAGATTISALNGGTGTAATAQLRAGNGVSTTALVMYGTSYSGTVFSGGLSLNLANHGEVALAGTATWLGLSTQARPIVLYIVNGGSVAVQGARLVLGTTDTTRTNLLLGGGALVAGGGTDGFPYIPMSAGTLTSTITAQAGFGAIAIDSTNHQFAFNDGTWHNILPGAVLIDGTDTTQAYLGTKLVAGAGVTLTVNNPGGNETITIAASGTASWAMAPTVRYFLVDYDGGNDSNVGYIDATALSTLSPAGKALKTFTRLFQIMPQDGAGRWAVVLIKARAGGATYLEQDGITHGQLNFSGFYNYGYLLRRGSTDLTNSAADRVGLGAIIGSAGPNGDQSYTTTAGTTNSTLVVASASFPAEPGIIGMRVRMTTGAAAGVCVGITANTSTQITLATSLFPSISVGDNFVIERPGVRIGAFVDGYDFSLYNGSYAVGLCCVDQYPVGPVGQPGPFMGGRGGYLNYSFIEVSCSPNLGSSAPLAITGSYSAKYLVFTSGYYNEAIQFVFSGSGFRSTIPVYLLASDGVQIDSSAIISPIGTNNVNGTLIDCHVFSVGEFGGVYSVQKVLFYGGAGGSSSNAFSGGFAGATGGNAIIGTYDGSGASRCRFLAGIETGTSCNISYSDITGGGATGGVRLVGDDITVSLNGVAGSTGNTYGLVVTGNDCKIIIGNRVATTLTGSSGDISCANIMFPTLAQLAHLDFWDHLGNHYSGSGRVAAQQGVRCTNVDGSAIAVGDWVRITNAGQCVRAQADTQAHATFTLGFAQCAAANGSDTMVAVDGMALAHYAADPVAPALVYLSEATAGLAKSASPAQSGTNQKLRGGQLLAGFADGSHWGLIRVHNELVPILSNGGI